MACKTNKKPKLDAKLGRLMFLLSISTSIILVDLLARIKSHTSSEGNSIDPQNAHASKQGAVQIGIIQIVEAKGVAGLGKAGGDGTGGSDKAGQQVPPEVYNALTYAAVGFLLTLSVPVMLYALNKLLNKIEDCFGCGPSSKTKKNGSGKNLRSNGKLDSRQRRPRDQHRNGRHSHQQVDDFDSSSNTFNGFSVHPNQLKGGFVGLSGTYHKHPYSLDSNRNHNRIVATTNNHPNKHQQQQHHQPPPLIHQPTAIDYSQSYSPDGKHLQAHRPSNEFQAPNELVNPYEEEQLLKHHQLLLSTPSVSPHVLGVHHHQSPIN